jgi:integrase
MARRLHDARLATREARLKLRPRGRPYSRAIEPGLFVRYRRLSGRSGSWSVRSYIGAGAYKDEALGAVADDYAEADGATVMTFTQAQRAALAHKPKVAGALTVKGAFGLYLASLSETAAADARYRVNSLILPVLGDLTVEALTAETLRAWLAALARSPAKRQTAATSDDERRRRRNSANRVLAILKAGLNHAFHEGLVPSDSAWRRVKPLKNAAAARVRYLTVAEARRLVNACAPDFRPLVEAALQTGARYSELARLRVHDFNPDSDTVTIGRSKSGRSRHVILTEEGSALFQRWCAGKAGNALLFARNGEAWGKGNQQRPMALAIERAKVEPPIGFHGLRHTWASLAVMGGMPLMIVARNLGHVDTKMVERHYAHLAPSYEAAAIRAHAPRFGVEPETKIAALPVRR